jgi:Zn-dependent protease
MKGKHGIRKLIFHELGHWTIANHFGFEVEGINILNDFSSGSTKITLSHKHVISNGRDLGTILFNL